MFLRPRRWGKSTFLQTLAQYYDKNNEPHFDALFGDLYIGQNPTQARTSLLVLCFDFSQISALDSFEETKTQFHDHLIRVLRAFLVKYYELLRPVDNTVMNAVEGMDGRAALECVLVTHNSSLASTQVLT